MEKNAKEAKGVQPEMVWSSILQEMEYFIRLCRTLYQLKSARELYRIGRTECPDLDQDVLKVIITAHFPVGQNLELETEFEGSQDEPRPSTLAEGKEDFNYEEARSLKEQSTTVEDDLQLSETDDNDSLVVVYMSSEED